MHRSRLSLGPPLVSHGYQGTQRPVTRVSDAVSEMEMAAFGDIPGVKFPSDSGSGETGAYWHPASVDPAVVLRSFARSGHWDGIAASRHNYHTLTGQKVLKVLFQRKRAIGVLFVPTDARDQSQARTVKARKEVILAAGTIHTPQVLQASGIGPKKLLKEAGVPIVVDSPGVGSNFQDQPFQVAPTFNCEQASSAEVSPSGC